MGDLVHTFYTVTCTPKDSIVLLLTMFSFVFKYRETVTWESLNFAMPMLVAKQPTLLYSKICIQKWNESWLVKEWCMTSYSFTGWTKKTIVIKEEMVKERHSALIWLKSVWVKVCQITTFLVKVLNVTFYSEVSTSSITPSEPFCLRSKTGSK